jgi:hypothetical protein
MLLELMCKKWKCIGGLGKTCALQKVRGKAMMFQRATISMKV